MMVLQALYNGLSMSLSLSLVSTHSGWLFAALFGIGFFVMPKAEHADSWCYKHP